MKFFCLFLMVFVSWGQTEQSCSISGRLTNMMSGAPARKARIVVTRPGPDRFNRTVNSDTNGRYRVSGLPPGRYRLLVQRDGFLPISYGAKGPNRPGKLLAVAPGQQLEDVNFALEPPAVISGRVLDEDAEPVPGVTVQSLHEDFGQGAVRYLPVRTAVTDDRGEYRLFGLPPGKFYLMSSQMAVGPAPGGSVYSSIFYPSTTDFAAATAIHVGAGGEARDIDLHVMKTGAAALRGTVANVPAGAEHSLQVQASRKDRTRVAFGNRSMGGYNATTGQFEFQGLTPGTYVIYAWIQDATRFLYARQEVEVAGFDISDIRLSLGSGMEIPGVVKFEGGAAPAGRSTRIWLSKEEFGGPSPTAQTAPDYSFVLKSVTPDTWTVGVMPVPPTGYIQSIVLGEDDGLKKPLTITSSSKGPLTIVLSVRGGQVEGTVRTSGDAPGVVESATVLLIPAPEYQGVTSYFKTATSDSEGHYRMVGIAPGKYRLIALEDLENGGYQDPEFLRRLEGKGKQISISPAKNAPEKNPTQDLTLEPL